MNVKINHRLGVVDVKFFNGINVSLKFDSLASTFSANFLFNEKNRQHAELACVSHFHEFILEHDGEKLINGFILDENFRSEPKNRLVQFAGYSKPGVLEDCEIPPTIYPLQSDGLTIAQIIQKIIAPFKLEMVIHPSVASKMNEVIPVSTAKEGQNIKSYITELCTQRGIIASHDTAGRLLFKKANTEGEPLFHVEKGVIATNIEMSFKGQGLHSDITIMKQADDEGGNAGEFTIQNPYVPIVTRTKVKTQTSGNDITIEQAAMNELAAELKEAIKLKVTIDRWKVNSKLVLPDNTITVYCPECYIYKKTKFFIESIDFNGDQKKEIAVLNCVIPEVYNGQIPKNLFVDAHENLPRMTNA